MAITVTGSNTSSGASAAASITHGLTINENDIVLAFIHTNAVITVADNNGANSFTKDFEAGWVSSATYSIFSRVAGASEPATYDFTPSVATRWAIVLVVVSGVDTSSIWDVAPDSANYTIGVSSTMSATSITTLTDNALALIMGGCDTGTSTTFSAPTNGFSIEAQENANQPAVVLSKAIPTAGAVGATNVTLSGTESHNGFMFALKEGAAGPTVTQTDTTPEDGVQQSFTTTGLTGTITAATLGGYDILSLLSDTDPTTATTYTLDISAIEASQGAPRIGQTSTLSITATGGTATTDVVIQPKTGWAEVDLAGTLNKDAGGFLALLDSTLGLTSAVGDIIYYDASSNAAITAAGVYTSDLTTAGQNTLFVIQQGGSATTVSTSEGGAFYPYGEASGGSSKVVQSINISSIRIGL